ncbi:DivIVA domain-containing protein [Microbacterium sp. ZW T2_14]|uniref:DivIVA domain-containing protein n=1 Tax=Microbacterium sp. ZW T2_14 TaxID=3378079 RepID=UPI0038547D47
MTATESVSITPELLRGVSFAEERHGYARAEVQALLAAAADALEVSWRDNEALTASGVTTEEGEISSRAVLLLSSAQRIADDAVAEAESYAKDLIETARKQYREIIERAQHVAHSIEKQAAAHPGAIAEAAAAQPAQVAAPAPGGRPAEPWADRSPSFAFATDDLAAAGPASPDDVVRARQFARMATAQVHSLLESIERELGRLGATPAQTPPQAPAPSSAQPSASPVPAQPPIPPAPAVPATQEQSATDDQPSNDRPWRRGNAGR